MVVVLASNGYPGAYPKGEVITEPENPLMEACLFMPARKPRMEKWSPRADGYLEPWVLCPTLADAKEKAYQLAEAVKFESKYYRSDIGHREFSRT